MGCQKGRVGVGQTKSKDYILGWFVGNVKRS